jgi:hypothetical protein
MQVLLLTDFSDNARIMQDYAQNFMGDSPVHFTLLHAKKPCENSERCKGKCNINLQKKLEDEYIKLRSKMHSNQSVSKVFINQNLIDAVRMYIKNSSTDLIFIGGRGQTSDTNRQFGKNTFDIVKKVRCPIMVVFENSVIKIPHKVAFPLDNSNQVQEKYLSTVKKLSFWKNIELSILEVPNKMLSGLFVKNLNKQTFLKAFSGLNFKIEQPHISNNKVCYNCIQADLIMFMAKNLNISNQIFDQIDTQTTDRQTPLLVLHA